MAREEFSCKPFHIYLDRLSDAFYIYYRSSSGYVKCKRDDQYCIFKILFSYDGEPDDFQYKCTPKSILDSSRGRIDGWECNPPYKYYKKIKNNLLGDRKATLYNAKFQDELFILNNIEYPIKLEINLLKDMCKVTFIDIETRLHEGKLNLDPKLEGVLCIGVKHVTYQKLYPVSNTDCFFFHTFEESMFDEFSESIMKFDPDIIVGHNLCDFDLPFIVSRSKQCLTPIVLGRLPSIALEKANKSFELISGRSVMDTLKMARELLLTCNGYSLNDVASHLEIGESKIDINMVEMFKDPSLNIDIIKKYCMQDVELCYKVFNAMNCLDYYIDVAEVSNISLSAAASGKKGVRLDGLFMQSLSKNDYQYGLVTVGKEIKKNIIGGFVHTPIPGCYDDVQVLDYVSMYPNLILTHNLKRFNSLEACPFVNIVEMMVTMRNKYRGTSISKAYKTLICALYGLLGAPSSKWYSYELASQITKMGRDLLCNLAKDIPNFNCKLIYGDTDSVMITGGDEKVYEQITKKHSDGAVALETKEYYQQFIIFSKKHYATLERGTIKTTKGLKSVRGDSSKFEVMIEERFIKLYANGVRDPLKIIEKILPMFKSCMLKRQSVFARKLKLSAKKWKSHAPLLEKTMKIYDPLFQAKFGQSYSVYVIDGKGPQKERLVVSDVSKIPSPSFSEYIKLLSKLLKRCEKMFPNESSGGISQFECAMQWINIMSKKGDITTYCPTEVKLKKAVSKKRTVEKLSMRNLVNKSNWNQSIPLEFDYSSLPSLVKKFSIWRDICGDDIPQPQNLLKNGNFITIKSKTIHLL